MLCALIRIASSSIHNILLSMSKRKLPKIIPNTIMSEAMFFFFFLFFVFCWGLKNEFEIAMVNEPSVLEPLKFYCIFNI